MQADLTAVAIEDLMPGGAAEYENRKRDEAAEEHLNKTHSTALRRLAHQWVYDVDWERTGNHDIRRRGTWQQMHAIKKYWQRGYREGLLQDYRAGCKDDKGSSRVQVEAAIRGARKAIGRARGNIIETFDVHGPQGKHSTSTIEAARISMEVLERALDARSKHCRGVSKYIKGQGRSDCLDGCGARERNRHNQIRSEMLRLQQGQGKHKLQREALCAHRWECVRTRCQEYSCYTDMRAELAAVERVQLHLERIRGKEGKHKCKCAGC